MAELVSAGRRIILCRPAVVEELARVVFAKVCLDHVVSTARFDGVVGAGKILPRPLPQVSPFTRVPVSSDPAHDSRLTARRISAARDAPTRYASVRVLSTVPWLMRTDKRSERMPVSRSNGMWCATLRYTTNDLRLRPIWKGATIPAGNDP